jgi:hypothetical protein
MATPFLDFIVKIGSDPAALAAFVENATNDPGAAALTPEQKSALLSTDFFSKIEPLLLAENPASKSQQEAIPGAQIGWNMFRIGAQILLARDQLANSSIKTGKGIS